MGFSLRQVAEQVPGLISVAGDDVSVSDITHDSRQAGPGSLFVAIPGEQFDGHNFVGAAIENGTSAVLVEKQQPGSIPQIIVENSRDAMPWAARAVFDVPDASLVIAGVTGTNGKTTVTHMIEAIMTSAGLSVGVIGTLGARINGAPLPIARTTPEATDLQRILARMRDDGVRFVLMEVSSHAIQLRRCDAIHFSVAGFTNLSQDHLDFHGDMEAYFEVKQRLFTQSVTDAAVINKGDPWGERLEESTNVSTTTVSLGADAEVSATDLVESTVGTSFTVMTPEGSVPVALPLVGRFNVANALVAIGMVSIFLPSAEGSGSSMPFRGEWSSFLTMGPSPW